jgi:glycogen debranching enzyme
MKSAYFLTKDSKLKKDISSMKNFLNKNLYDSKEKRFYVAIDKKGPLKADSSDTMHALFYLDEEDIPGEAVEKIVQDSSALETLYGYRALSEKDSYRISDPYHAMTLWPFEQAIINIGARKFRLKKLEQISSRVLKYLTSSPELFDIVTRKEGKVFKKGGCDPQLWTIAAREYFKNKKSYKIII